MSSLSDREQAGLLMLLPSNSSSQRMVFINMYSSLATLAVQELLRNLLKKIAPVTVSQRQ